MFGARFHHPHQQMHRRAQMQLWITLADVASGGPRAISVGTQHGTQTVEIEIPQGIHDGDNVQYGGVGPGGIDLIVTYRIHPNPKWHRHGQNLTMEQTVSVWDLILGKELTIRDILGNTFHGYMTGEKTFIDYLSTLATGSDSQGLLAAFNFIPIYP